MTIEEILKKVKSGELSVEEAEKRLCAKPFEELEFAKPDTHRKLRCGCAEVIYCEGKSDEHLLGIFKSLLNNEEAVMGTRASLSQANLICSNFPQAVYDSTSRIIRIGGAKELSGNVLVCSAGTSDIPVAKEAAQTLTFFGSKVTELFDVGVSGLHRLLSNLDKVNSANCIVTVAGMEGALASVVAGLTDAPVIAVPTSVGYGASFGGISALLTMINSCANSVSVVNIDNGFGAGYIANRINMKICKSCAAEDRDEQ